MGTKENNLETLTVPKPSPSPSPIENVSQTSSSHPNHQNPNHTSPKKPLSPKDFVISVAANYASQPLQNYDPDVWGVLTAISNNARKRHQGINMLLTADEHCIGRLVEDTRFQIESSAVSANHCKIYRKKVASEDAEHPPNCYTSVFLKDTSTNGTYLNWERLKKNSSEVKVQHGDIISFAAPPQHELAFAFVYREVLRPTPLREGTAEKRKADEYVSENKRLKGIGICSPDGPLSLDDFRSLQRSNTELRKQLESQVLEIDKLRNENRTVVERCEKEMKEIKESVTKSYLDQLKTLHDMLDAKQKELAEVNRISAEQKHAIEDLNERLSASMQSCTEANEIMKSQKISIAELNEQLDQERDLRRVEREKAEADLKAAVQKAQLEAQEELKRLSDAASRREIEQQEVINKLQIVEKQSSSQVESLKLKLDETREKLVISDNKVRQLEAQVYEEQLASASGKKRVEELEHESRKLRKELESEKAAREEAWAKVSTLELEINAAMRDLDFERRRLKAARERIMLRETQLRAFYSTTEEISVLFAKQQEQLKAMQKTLEDEENYENTSVDIDLNVNNQPIDGEKQITGHHSNIAVRAGSATSAQRFDRIQIVTSSDEVSTTEKHDCDIRSQDEGQNTEEAEFTSADRTCKGGFGSDIDGVGTAPMLEGDPIGTEQALEILSPGIDGERNIYLNKSGTLAGDTMQLEDESHGHDSGELVLPVCQETVNHSPLNNPVESQKATEDIETGGTIRTADLLASEVAGSWACSTAPSVHGENESPRSRDNEEEGTVGLQDSSAQVAESQSMPSSKAAANKCSREHQALRKMIGIASTDPKDLFGDDPMDDDFDHGRGKQDWVSSSDTEDCADSDKNDRVDGKCSGTDTEASDKADEDQNKDDDAMDEDDEATQEDSLG
ncbi:SMAD/FHA domain-containing protein, putative isoform 1 [Melia azedarach]|uniref:SMAD/FHA domain-containing protein, putative isoform 1 n=1 Tax=Melia azedarach TaxID=155640 RepID=A0ACC1YTS7_MELAZ|nr:SMAD/FHA domain-containing protein, putative isoform 1 [Melia azedarach]